MLIRILALVKGPFGRQPRRVVRWQGRPGEAVLPAWAAPPAPLSGTGPLGSGYSWSDAANWSPAAVPSAGDGVQFVTDGDPACTWVFGGGSIGGDGGTAPWTAHRPAPPEPQPKEAPQ